MLGLLRPNVRSRFLYYVSDLPLSVGTSLATKMTTWEGIPPLYAITRALLQKVFMPIQVHDFAARMGSGATAPMHTDSSHAAVHAAHKWQTIRKGKSNPLSMWMPHKHIRRASVLMHTEPSANTSPARTVSDHELTADETATRKRFRTELMKD